MNLMVMKSILKNLQFEPYASNEPYKAVQVFKDRLMATCCNRRFDLVITDIQMPEMDGFRVAECIRAIEMACSSKKSQSN